MLKALMGFFNAVKDSPKVAEWRKKAETGDAFAQYLLGSSYDSGVGVPRDDAGAEAVKWYRLAAEQGLADAQSSLGDMYYNDKGVPKDLVQAHVWWNIAGANGYPFNQHVFAKKNLAFFEKQMTDSQKEKAMDLARELFAKLPEGSSINSTFVPTKTAVLPPV